MQNNKSRIRAIILIVILIVISLLLMRFILEFSQNEQPSIISSILLLPTNFLGLFFSSIKIGAIEISTIVGIIFFIVCGYLISKIISAMEMEDSDSTYLELIEAFTRLFEFLIIFRVLLKFIGTNGINSPFAAVIYFLTGWTGFLLKPVDLVFGTLDISALVMLGIVLLVDINTEIVLRGVKFIKTGSAKSVDFISKNTIQAAAEKFNRQDEKKAPSTSGLTPEDLKLLEPTVLPPAQAENPQPEVQPQIINIENSTVQIEPAAIQVEPPKVPLEVSKKKTPKTKHKDDKTAPEG